MDGVNTTINVKTLVDGIHGYTDVCIGDWIVSDDGIHVYTNEGFEKTYVIIPKQNKYISVVQNTGSGVEWGRLKALTQKCYGSDYYSDCYWDDGIILCSSGDVETPFNVGDWVVEYETRRLKVISDEEFINEWVKA